MRSAKIWVDISTGIVNKADSTFQKWVESVGFGDIHVDEYFSPERGESMYAGVMERAKNYPLHYIRANAEFKGGRATTFITFIDLRHTTLDDTVPLRVYPLSPQPGNIVSDPSSIPPQLFDAITDFVMVCAPDFTIQKANRATKAVFGGVEEVEGRKCYEVLRGKDGPCQDCPLLKTLHTGKMIPNEYYDTNLREYLEMRTYPNIDADDNWQDYTIVSRVVSRRREQEGENVQNKKLQALGQMASGLAHDFNNMLAIILGRVQLLKSRTSEAGMVENLKTIEKAALDSTDIIQRLQDFTRKRDAADEMQVEPIEVNVVVEDVIKYVQTRIDRLRKQAGIRIEIDKQLRDVLPVEGNQTQLRSALLNILFNSIDAMEIGGMISIWTQQLGTQIEIGIADTGVGMTANVKEKIFDPFFTTKGENGNGLGLSEVYGIVNQHNGIIKVDSTPGEGTTILLNLPVMVSNESKENAV